MDSEENPENINFIPCLKWIKKDVASTNPQKIQLSKNELAQVIKDTQEKLRVNREREESSAENNYNFENYDEAEDTATTLGIDTLAEVEGDADDNFDESDDSDKEDDEIRSSDNLILAGHIQGDSSVLEIYVYNEEEAALYVHHDILLSDFPLCLEWMDYEPDMPKGNYCAVGTMSPIIEVWDLDLINSIEPSFKLGRIGGRKRPAVGHTDAVLALAWNQAFDHVLASASVDKSIILWDMESKTVNTTINIFQEKIQSIKWHPKDSQTLLAGGCDHTAKIFDCRNPTTDYKSWDLNGEAEKIIWNPHEINQFIVGTNEGFLQCFDRRKGLQWEIPSHENEITGLEISEICPGLMVTSSMEGPVKVWDLDKEQQPKCVAEKSFVGSVHSLVLSNDLPFVITVGTDSKSDNFHVYDLQNIDNVKEKFDGRQLISSQVDESME